MFVLVELSFHAEKGLVIDLHKVKAYLVAHFQTIGYRAVLHQRVVIAHAKLLEIKVYISIVALDNVA